MNMNLTLRYEDNQMKIKHKLTSEVLLTIEGDSLQGANLQEANLQGANLQEADLQGANLATDVIRINGMRWDVTILHGYMRIGCQHHYVDDWNKFTDGEISKMDDNALEFWRANKHKLITIANFTK